MRNMSFFLTTLPMLYRIKGCTRRLGWWDTQEHDLIMAVEKCQGLKKGQKIKRLYPIRVLKVDTQPLSKITAEDVRLEGFPNMTPDEFIDMFINAHKGKGVHAWSPVKVIYFTEYPWTKSKPIPPGEPESTSQPWFASCPSWYQNLCKGQLVMTSRNSKALKQIG